MTEHRQALLDAMKTVIEGGDIDHDALVTILHPNAVRSSLLGLDGEAYWELWRWADDCDIRAKEPGARYQTSQRASMARLHNRLAAAGCQIENEKP